MQQQALLSADRNSDIRMSLLNIPEVPQGKDIIIRLNENAQEIFNKCLPPGSRHRYIAIQLGKGAAYGTLSLVVLTALGGGGYEIGKAILSDSTPQDGGGIFLETFAGTIIEIGGLLAAGYSAWRIKDCVTDSYKKWAEEEKKLVLVLPEAILETAPAEENSNDESVYKRTVGSVKNAVDYVLPHGSVRRFSAIQAGKVVLILIAVATIGALGQPIAAAIPSTKGYNYLFQATVGGTLIVSSIAIIAFAALSIIACGSIGKACCDYHKENYKNWSEEERTNLLPDESGL